MLCNKLTIRPSTLSDMKSVRRIEKKAFGRKAEADLVDALIDAPDFTISLVGQCDDELVGHILLTEISAPVKALALAPLAVLPQYREMQVGSELVRAACAAAKDAGFEAIFVLGDAPYYERFGFSSALADRFKVAWQGKNFMALELRSGSLKNKKGPIEYPEPFVKI